MGPNAEVCHHSVDLEDELAGRGDLGGLLVLDLLLDRRPDRLARTAPYSGDRRYRDGRPPGVSLRRDAIQGMCNPGQVSRTGADLSDGLRFVRHCLLIAGQG